MTDPRQTLANGRVADSALRETCAAPRYADPVPHRVIHPRVALTDETGTRRERELRFGDRFDVLETVDARAFGRSARDGYVGHVDTAALAAEAPAPTHRVAARLAQTKRSPSLKAWDDALLLPQNALVAVTDTREGWAAIAHPEGPLHLPAAHLAPLGRPATDPVAVAEICLGAPYLWGGNTPLGIDCSGLVETALFACGIPCPGDSDLQEAALGITLPAGTPPRRGDLLFWAGHVAWLAGPDRLLHANAHHMATVFEPLAEAVARIVAQGGGPVTRHARLAPP